jgi:hypothetical protein
MALDTLTIVCYTGGTCGDLISALIDPTHARFQDRSVIHTNNRQLLKKPHTFANNEEKDRYVNDISTQYLSIPSHDLDYHVQRGHKFISITVQDFNVAMWAAQRFKKLHRPQVWQEMQTKCGASTIEDYAQMLIHYSNMVATHTNNIVKLEDIQNGLALDSLKKLGINVLSKNLYQNWLDLQNNRFII